MDKQLEAVQSQIKRRLSGVEHRLAERFTPMQRQARENEILIYDDIINSADAEFFRDVFGDEMVMSGTIFREKLDAIQGDVVVRINCKGGDTFECQAILNAISERKEKGDKVDMIVDGVAFSAASLIMLYGSSVEVSPLSMIMIHNCQLTVRGSVKEVRKIADTAEKTDEAAAALYQQRMTSMSLEEVKKALDEETWYSAEDSVRLGLADRVVEQAIDESDEEEMKRQEKEKLAAERRAADEARIDRARKINRLYGPRVV